MISPPLCFLAWHPPHASKLLAGSHNIPENQTSPLGPDGRALACHPSWSQEAGVTDLVVIGQLLPSPHLLHHQVPEVTLGFQVSLEDILLGHHLNLQSGYS